MKIYDGMEQIKSLNSLKRFLHGVLHHAPTIIRRVLFCKYVSTAG